MSKQHFNKEMENYLNKKEDSERFSELVDIATQRAEKGEKGEVIIIKEKSNFQYYLDKTLGRLKKKKHVDIEDIEDEELEKVQEKPEDFVTNIINKIKDFFSPGEEDYEEDTENDEEDSEVDEVKEDFRAMAKFATKLINQLPRRKAEALKEDKDFKMFKEILKKREIIKE